MLLWILGGNQEAGGEGGKTNQPKDKQKGPKVTKLDGEICFEGGCFKVKKAQIKTTELFNSDSL